MKAVKTNLNLYKSFIEVYETKNFSVAAHNLHLTQPTISYNIKELEKQLKVRLFNSNSRGVEPTKHSEELYPIVREAFINLLNAEDTVQEFDENSKGTIRIAMSLSFPPFVVGEIVSEFNGKYPNIKFEIAETSIEKGTDSIGRHQYDILFYARFANEKFDKNLFTVLDLSELNSFVYASKDFIAKHNLSGTVTKEQLLKLPMISISKTYQMRGEIEKTGLGEESIIETNSTQIFVNLAKRGIGYIVAPSGYLGDEFVKLNVTGLTLPKCYVSAKYNNNLANKAASSFIQILKDKYSN